MSLTPRAALAAVIASAWLSGSGCGWTSANARDARDVPRASALPQVPPSTLRALDVERFLGKWHIVATNYDFWKTRTHATVTYQRIGAAGGKPVKLRDVVAYRDLPWCPAKRPSPGDVVGVDIQDPSRAGHFQWRGDGLLHLIRSQWFVVWVSPDYQHAVTWFADSNFGTGSGTDVYSRSPSITDAKLGEVLDEARRDPFIAERSRGMFYVPQN
ncbi:MAG: hypothetical protein KC503_43110 [Myxococcales bacterium]|nr:hypothetical protein [Myxococcales bacterium]